MRLFLGFLVFLVWASIARLYYVCEIKNLCNEPVEEPIEDLRPNTLSLILDDSITLLKNYEEFAFEKDGIQPNLSENNKMYLDSVANFMKNDTLLNLSIKGFFRESESGDWSGIYEDLGTARAAGIRALLISRGIPEKSISLESNLSADETMSEPLTFDLYNTGDAIPDEFSKVQFSFTNMTYSDANFELNSDVFAPGEAFKFYADSVVTFFELNPGKTLTIIGHCDDSGTEKYNYDLGLRRAKNTQLYFEKLGLKSGVVKTNSKGETEPIVPNDTDENRQKNRRVNFIIE
jgi:outer membrane protein OmpA-like peptidoglycan-associated protein